MATDYGWTPRQREVLDLITRGRTNQEIADRLGISLDGAKWHMREILSKLGVDTREEAAEYWRRYNGVAPRFARLFRAVTGASAGKWLAGALVGGALIGMGAVALALALNGGGDEPAANDTEPTSTPGTATASPTTLPTPGTPVALVITLDTSPKPQPPEVTRTLGSPPDSAFPPWDGVSTFIYDTQTGKAVDLGPGAQPASFSPDETMAVFAAGGSFANGEEVFLVDLPSGQRRSLGAGRLAVFGEDGQVYLYAPTGNSGFRVDPDTGDRTPAQAVPGFTDNSPQSAPAGYETEPWGTGGTEVRTFTVRTDSGDLVITVDAIAVTAAGPSEVAVAAPAVDGRSNVYVVSLVTGEATFVASAVPGNGNFPFSATDHYVLWTDGYCGPDRGPVTLFDRRSGELIRFELSGVTDPNMERWMRLTSTGLLAVGSFGATYLIEPESLEYVANIPSRPDGYGGDVWWSTNHRFASHGPYGGHGGLC